MDLRHLRYFVVLAEELHFGRAAKRLGISQPPLSQQIRALEEEVGATLLERTSRRTNLTEAGKVFLREARKTLAQAERSGEIARRAQRGEIGELNIGFTPSAPLTPKFRSTIRAFGAAYPDVRLTFHELSTRQQAESLMAGSLDIGFLRTAGERPMLPDALAVSATAREELVAFLPGNHPMAGGYARTRIPITSFADDPLLLFSREIGGTTYDQVLGLCRRAGFAPRLGQEAREAVTLLGLVAAGLGVTVLASSYRQIQYEGVVMRRLARPVPSATTWLSHNRDNDSPIIQTFLAIEATGVGGRL
ncbi:MAG: LysR substrate-binding domain-containing protein [Hyphomicrobiaceae bacterium]